MELKELIASAVTTAVETATKDITESVSTVLATAGADLDEYKDLVKCRFNDKLTSIPLGDWCKDHDYNRVRLFNFLRAKEYLDEVDNSLTDDGFGQLHNLSVGVGIKLGDIVLFNTNLVANGTYTVMINPSSPHYKSFVALIGHLKEDGGYRGSKSFNARKVCKTMRHLCPSYPIIE